jgi:fibronectin-binding autotransporter adhesin
MALNSDFKVKDSLYVGNSACFVTQTNTPVILSAGASLFDIFLQEGESGSGVLSDGDGITDFMFNSLSAATVAVDATVLRSTGSTFTGVLSANIAGGRYLSAGSDFSELFSNCQGTVTSVGGGNGIDSSGGTTPQLSISGGDGIISSSQDIHVDSTVIRTTGNQTIGGTKTFTALTPFNAGLTAAVGGVGTIGLSATAANSGILSAGKDLNEIFQIIGSDARGKVLSDGIGIQDFTYEGLSAQTVAVSQSILSGGASHAQGTLTLSGAGGTGYNTTVDLGLQTSDSPTFAGVTATGNLSIQGNTQLGNASSDTITIDSAGICTPNLAAGTGSSVLVRGSTSDGVLTHDVIDSKVFEQKLVDYGTLGQCSIPVATNSTGTVCDSIMEQTAASGGFDVVSINVLGGLSALSLSGDGTGLTGVTAEAIFPTTTKTTLVGGDKFFINDSANKHTTYTALLTSFGAGSGLTVDGTSLEVNGASSLTSGKITKWNGTGFTNSIMTETALGNISIAGGATITGNLSVQGELTCIDTTVSVTSALSVVNAGTGPAIFARQTGTDEPIARFVDTEGGFITFDDGGSVGIGIDAPAAKLDVVGDAHISTNLTVDGNTQLGNASSDTITIDSAGICTPCLAAGTGTSVLVRGSTSDGIVTHDVVDSKIFGTLLVDGEGDANKLPKYTNGTGTIGNSVITDTGSLVTIDSNTKIDEGHSFQVFAPADPLGASLDSYSQKQTFSTIVTSASTHPVNTFCKTNLKQVKYNVTLIKGVNITSFEVNAVNNNTTTIGTVYGIVDAQAATQLDTASVCNSANNVTLLLKSASAGTCAIITGEALYAS